MIRIDGVSRLFGSRNPIRALDAISLEIPRGQRLAVMGPSGSGKSTLLNLMAGLDTPTTGSISIDGVALSGLSDDGRTCLRRQRIGLVFQAFNLLPTLTALENVALPLRLQGSARREARRRALAMLERVALQHRADHRPDELSGGENQRVAIARALVVAPVVLLADEPTGNLDSTTGLEILRLLNAVHGDAPVTMVVVTHNEAAAAWCDRTVTLRDGRVAGDSAEARR